MDVKSTEQEISAKLKRREEKNPKFIELWTICLTIRETLLWALVVSREQSRVTSSSRYT